MKLGRISVPTPDGAQARIVALTNNDSSVVDLSVAYAASLRRRGANSEGALRLARALFPSSMSQAIAAGDVFLDAAHEALGYSDEATKSVEEVSWIAAVDSPVIRDCLTYPTHMQNFLEKVGNKPDQQAFKTPPFFKGSASRIYGTGEVLPYPGFTEYLDWEFEVGIIVGRQGHNLTAHDAEKHIFGYTIFNDWSARDVQPREMAMGMGPQKSKDFAFGIGPVIVTADELPEIDGLKGQVRLNDEVISTVESTPRIFSSAELVAWVSVADAVLPGDLIGTGTMGFGSGFELDKRLSPGDVLELDLEKVGVLKTPIGEIETTPWWPDEKPFAWDENWERVGY
ncbi:fumarylacetoacetate hydrolase family protein [Nocardioides sp. NBC_00368]|uniref:fumarylacetoacetate hydrolase family protein n=1 Tax=Nocardioides sp. NBC_00368 TaxID=2976000 RepID=UPI002E1A3AEE